MASTDRHQQGEWVAHFPRHASWSNATLICKGMAPYGAVALAEIDRIGTRLRGREGDAAAWRDEWCAMAGHVERMGDAAAAEAHDLTAGHYYLRAGNYYYTGERMVPPGPEKQAIYEKALRCYRAGLARRHPEIEPVEVPLADGTSLPAYFMRSPWAAGPAPTVVLFDGLDNCKEMSVLFAGLEFARRGFHTLAVDGPGQGEAIRLRGIRYRHDYEVPGAAAFDYVAGRGDVDRSRVAVMGYSFGGYCAPRVASLDPRYSACVAFGATYWDMAEWLANKYRIAGDASRATTSDFQIQWVLGTASREESFVKMRRFTLDGVVQRMACPFLVVHGEDDPLVPIDSVRRLHAEAGSADKTLKIFSAEEGGSQHCQVDDRQAGVDFIADWLADRWLSREAGSPSDRGKEAMLA
ncbi:alpha/beta hydrolase [Propylenella binzhouense]|uniref:alpha/beta hydrolase n=1 Tax=Propylenella binzhouense TaxID=2555902 RepID=UPI00136B5B75